MHIARVARVILRRIDVAKYAVVIDLAIGELLAQAAQHITQGRRRRFTVRREHGRANQHGMTTTSSVTWSHRQGPRSTTRQRRPQCGHDGRGCGQTIHRRNEYRVRRCQTWLAGIEMGHRRCERPGRSLLIGRRGADEMARPGGVIRGQDGGHLRACDDDRRLAIDSEPRAGMNERQRQGRAVRTGPREQGLGSAHSRASARGQDDAHHLHLAPQPTSTT